MGGALRWRLVAAGAIALVAATPPRVAPAVPHNMHVANSRMVVEGAVIVARVRMFRDDLQKALRQPVSDDAASRAAVAAYVGRNFTLAADGVTLTGEVLDGGGDMDGDQPIWWVIVQWKAAKPVKALGVKVHLMFETFNDQQNIVMVAKQPGDHRQGLYFQAGDRAEQVLKF
jgi:hypothetical protein